MSVSSGLRSRQARRLFGLLFGWCTFGLELVKSAWPNLDIRGGQGFFPEGLFHGVETIAQQALANAVFQIFQ